MRTAPLRGIALSALLALLPAAGACAQVDAPPAGQAGAAGPPPGGAALDSGVARAERGREKGSDSARVTVVEISDFECPFCARFAVETYPRLDSAYVRTGRVRFVYLNLPLPNHHRAYPAAEAALCAGAQGRFWPMHDRLFAAQEEWSRAADAGRLFEGYAAGLQLDLAAYRQCTGGDQVASIILRDAMQAAGAGVNGTPAFFIVAPGAQPRSLSGAVPYDEFARELDEVLAGAPAGPAAAPAAPPPAN